MRLSRAPNWIIHPVLFAVYPVAFLMSENIGEMRISESFRAFVVAAVFGALLAGLSRLFIRSWPKAGAIASLLVAVTFLYSDYSAAYWQVILVLLSTFAAIIAIYLSKRDWARVTVYLNLVATLLLLISLYKVVPYQISRVGERDSSTATATLGGGMNSQTSASTESAFPNIYYVILDGYGRDDVLERFYAHDNRYFTEFLREQGFYIADRARSNYARTALSVISTLYASHLVDFIEQQDLVESRDVQLMMNLLPRSSVFAFLRARGYNTHAYSSTNIEYPAAESIVPQAPFSYFEREVAARTPFGSLLDKLYELNSYRIHHRVIQETLSHLNEAIELPGPKFVLAHVVCPHPPLVFDRDGNYRNLSGDDHRLSDGDAMVGVTMTEEEYQRQYSDQVHWLNGQMMRWVKSVRSADPEAVIIIQADHGPGSMLKWNDIQKTNMLERFSILNAICIPGHSDALYPQMSNVNTFRIVFNEVFDADFPLEPDTSYFSESSRPFLLHQIHFPDSAKVASGSEN